jgi:hypothetical protein
LPYLRCTFTGAAARSTGVLFLVALATATVTFPVGAQTPGSAKPQAPAESPTVAQIDRNGALILIRSALIALDHANKTDNYSVLRDLGAPGFQVNSDAQLAEIFATQRKDNLDLSAVLVLEPQLTVLPQIVANGMMRMAGFFPSAPTQVNFDLLYAPVNRQWRLFGISVALGQATPVAPEAPQPPPPARAPAPSAKGKTPQARDNPPAAEHSATPPKQ